MPGMAPWWASSLRQIRQRRNLRYTERGRPQRLHRVYTCVLCLGVRFCLTRSEVLAIPQLSLLSVANGIPSARRRARAWSSVSAVVVIATSSPRIDWTLS